MNSGDLALYLVVAGVLVELTSIFAIDRRLNREHNFMVERGTAGEQLGDWLLYSDAEGEPRNIEVITDLISNRLIQHEKFSTMQGASVDARIQNKYDEKVMGALKSKVPVGYKIIMRIAEELGFNLEEIIEANELAPFLASLDKHNIPLMMGNQMNPTSGSRKTW